METIKGFEEISKDTQISTNGGDGVGVEDLVDLIFVFLPPALGISKWLIDVSTITVYAPTVC